MYSFYVLCILLLVVVATSGSVVPSNVDGNDITNIGQLGSEESVEIKAIVYGTPSPVLRSVRYEPATPAKVFATFGILMVILLAFLLVVMGAYMKNGLSTVCFPYGIGFK
uniref:Col_cuticle_N domain-containing protein n=1 Tax=Steinernema glaseri TaxID=37863 RepID=A0A1I7YFX8_9BILA